MIRSILTLTAALMIATACSAETPKREAKPAASVKEKFFVYGGFCSRSIELRGTYDDIQEACRAAMDLRDKQKLKFVTVRTGAHDRDPFGTAATQYTVYRNPCKGWLMDATFEKGDKARERAEQLKKHGDLVEIVLHYAAK